MATRTRRASGEARAARPRTRGSSRASRSGRPSGGGGSSRRATGSCRGRRRRPPRRPRACSRPRRRRAARRARCSSGESRSCDHSIVARSVCCRSSASRPPLKVEPLAEPVEDLLGGERLRARGGELERERHVVEAAAELLDRRTRGKSGAQAEELDRVRVGERQHRVLDLAADAEQLAGGDEQRFGQASTAGEPARVDTCSRLSSSSSSSRSPMCAARSPCAPSVCATVGTTALASWTVARPTQKTPSGTRGRAPTPPRSPGASSPSRPGRSASQPRAVAEQRRDLGRPRARARRSSTPAAAGSCSRSSSAAGTARRRAGRSRPARRSPSAGARPDRARRRRRSSARRLREQHLPAVPGRGDPRARD